MFTRNMYDFCALYLRPRPPVALTRQQDFDNAPIESNDLENNLAIIGLEARRNSHFFSSEERKNDLHATAVTVTIDNPTAFQGEVVGENSANPIEMTNGTRADILITNPSREVVEIHPRSLNNQNRCIMNTLCGLSFPICLVLGFIIYAESRARAG